MPGVGRHSVCCECGLQRATGTSLHLAPVPNDRDGEQPNVRFHSRRISMGFCEGGIAVRRRVHTPLNHRSEVGFRSRHIPTQRCPFHPLRKRETVALDLAGGE